MMPLQGYRYVKLRKKKRVTSTEAAPVPDSPPQASDGQKHFLHLSNRLSSKFWDNLSRIWLTRPAIQEFDRGAVQLAMTKPESPLNLKGCSVKKLKHFARHGSPSLCDMKGVGSSNSCL